MSEGGTSHHWFQLGLFRFPLQPPVPPQAVASPGHLSWHLDYLPYKSGRSSKRKRAPVSNFNWDSLVPKFNWKSPGSKWHISSSLPQALASAGWQPCHAFLLPLFGCIIQRQDLHSPVSIGKTPVSHCHHQNPLKPYHQQDTCSDIRFICCSHSGVSTKGRISGSWIQLGLTSSKYHCWVLPIP